MPKQQQSQSPTSSRTAEVRAQELIFSGATLSRYRFVQDSPVLPEIWLKFVELKFRDSSVEVLLTPHHAGGASLLYHRLAALRSDRFGLSHVAANESHVVADLMYGGLLALLPLTAWWRQSVAHSEPAIWHHIQALATQPSYAELAAQAIREQLEVSPTHHRSRAAQSMSEQAVYPALRRVARRLRDEWFSDPNRDDGTIQILSLILTAGALPCVCEQELKDTLPQELAGSIRAVASVLLQSASMLNEVEGPTASADGQPMPKARDAGLIWSISTNRTASHAMYEARRTLKADASELLFRVSTADVLWAVIDSGIDARHPAFLSADAGDPSKLSTDQIIALSRVSRTVDFTRLRPMLSGLPADESAPWYARMTAAQKGQAAKVLADSAEVLKQGRMIDWKLLAPLLEVPHASNAEYFLSQRSSHGTHVAGILGADWRPERYEAGTAPGELADGPILGVCPDIQLLDLRVFDEDGRADEFTILAALQYVRFLNQSRGSKQVLGVNLSLSLRHDVRNYGCGVTPICVECNRLVGSGVVVVAAAGNFGYEDTASDYLWGGSFRGVTVTDPGNAQQVITVGSTHRSHPHDYGVSYFSSRGPTGDGRMKPDLVAPGEKIVSVIPDRRADERDGTSMAAPMVSGVAAMLMARHRELQGNPQRIKEILCATATDLGREPAFQGAGLVDALRALQSL